MIEKILIVEDQLNLRKLLLLLLQKDYQVVAIENAEEAFELIQQQSFDLVLLDNRLPQMTGLDLLKAIKHSYPDICVILMTAYADVATAVEALKLGVFDYIIKPFDLDKFKKLIKRTLELNRSIQQRTDQSQLITPPKFDKVQEILTNSSNMMELCRDIAKVSQSKATILITGESGTGKELVAKTIHYYSTRSDKPFIKINCGALADTLLESILFGHEKGAFTGAYQRQIGLFDRANQGTLFLDEVSEMSENLQVKLLRVIQEKEFEPIGGNHPIKSDFRLITATNRNLQDMVIAGKFRQDLFYRLNVIGLNLPPLRDRKSDIMILARYFMQQFCVENNKHILDFSEQSVALLNHYNWPGNVRELSNAIEYAVIMSHGLFIEPEDLPKHIHNLPIKSNHIVSDRGSSGNTLKERIKNYEKVLIADALRKNKGHRDNTAKDLGVSRRTLLYKLQEYEIG